MNCKLGLRLLGEISITSDVQMIPPYWGFTGGSDGKESASNARDQGSILGLGNSPGERNGSPVQSSCLENSMDRWACMANVYVVAKKQTWLTDTHTHTHTHHPNGRKWRGTKEPLDESERGERKSRLKAPHSENEGHSIRSHHFMANRWGNSERLYFLGLQNHCRWWLQPWN